MAERKSYETTLPSRGLLYGDKVKDGKVKVYPIRVFEEKMLAGGTGNGSDKTNQLLKSCLATEIDPKELLLVDRMFLLCHLGLLSYGSERELNVTCQECKHQFPLKVDMTQFDITYAEDGLEDQREVTLPVSGDKVVIRLLRGTDEGKIISMDARLKKSKKVGGVDSLLVLQMMLPIVSVNDKELSGSDLIEWIENMIAQDARALRDAINKTDFGIDTSTEVICPACSEEFSFEFPAENFLDMV